jgi:metallo-beta-lactamase class B
LRQSIAIILLGLIFGLPYASSAFAQDNADWTEPFPAFRIAGSLYYVGSRGPANYLITTPQGNILINGDLEANVPMIETSIEQLGFNFQDTKILLISHANWDHAARSAKIREMTGARYMVMPCDIFLGAHGGYFGLEEKYPHLKDGDASPFIDPNGHKEFVVQKEQDFPTELAKQTLTEK